MIAHNNRLTFNTTWQAFIFDTSCTNQSNNVMITDRHIDGLRGLLSLLQAVLGNKLPSKRSQADRQGIEQSQLLRVPMQCPRLSCSNRSINVQAHD